MITSKINNTKMIADDDTQLLLLMIHSSFLHYSSYFMEKERKVFGLLVKF